MEELLYGTKGEIDTEAERSILEYRPKVKYEPNKPFTVNLPVEEVTEEDPEENLDEDGNYLPSEKPAKQYDQFATTWKLLNQMIDFTKEKIKDVKIPLSEKQIETLYESFPFLGQQLEQQGFIDFETYEKTFEDPDAPGNSLIQDIVHSYAEDVEGSLDLELFEDLKEMQSTVAEGFFLFRESILKNYMDGDIPATPEKNEEITKQIDEAVKKQKEWFMDITENYESKELEYYESLKSEYGSPEFYKKTEEYMQKKRPYDIALREEKTLKEMGLLVDGLLIGSEECSELIKSGLVFGSKIDSEEVMKVLENQATTKEQLAGLMKLTQLSLKLQVNQQIEEKKQYRDVLKNINSLSRKKRAHDELLMAFELRNKMYLNMYDTMQHLESPSKAPGVEAFLNQLAGGLSLVQGQYDSFLQDVYLMYVSEHEVRKEKIGKALDKENARAGYSLVLDYQ